MLNADLSLRVVIDTGAVPWTPSPEPGVARRMLERHGPESGRATSIVRYAAGATFPIHEHPLGEEIFVLEGAFSDHLGDYPAGTFVLNPPGSRHAPQSASGCMLFVKLCQYAGEGRERRVIDTARMEWRPWLRPGTWAKDLYRDERHREYITLLKWDAGLVYPHHTHRGGEEILVLEGTLADGAGSYPRGTWIRDPKMSAHAPFTREGCVFWMKLGGF